MSVSRSAMAYLGAMIACMTSAQIFLKLAGMHAASNTDMLHGFLGNPWLLTGLAVSGIGMLCWLLTLRRLPLASAYPWTALVYVFTPLASAALFGDPLSIKYLIGMACIVAGVFLTAQGVRR